MQEKPLTLYKKNIILDFPRTFRYREQRDQSKPNIKTIGKIPKSYMQELILKKLSLTSNKSDYKVSRALWKNL